jgi:Transposase DDE domain group 1
MRVKRRSLISSVQVVADGDGLVSRAGTGLLVGLADRLGLTDALSMALGDVRERRSRHDPGRVVRDLVVMLCVLQNDFAESSVAEQAAADGEHRLVHLGAALVADE